MRKIKWGVMGSGGIARRRTIPEGIIPAQNAKLVSVFDINSEINKAVAEQFNACPADSVDDLLNTDIEAVYIATPANMHCEQTVVCAKAGKHVFCEKPLGLTVGDVKKMMDVCDKHNVKLGCAFMMRFHSQHQAAMELIKEGKLGKLCYGRAQLSCWYPPIKGAWRQDKSLGGGGALMDLGGHCIDLLEMFFGKVVKVSCFINNNVHQFETEDSAVTMLYFEDGAIATIDTFFCIPDNASKNVLEIYGSKGSITAKGTIGQGSAGDMKAYIEPAIITYDPSQSRTESKPMNIVPLPINIYRAEIEDFSEAVIKNRPPSNSSQIALGNQLILDACYRSSKEGLIVNV